MHMIKFVTGDKETFFGPFPTQQRARLYAEVGSAQMKTDSYEVLPIVVPHMTRVSFREG